MIFPEPKEGSVFYEDGRLYACLARFPKKDGHIIVAWKEKVEDIGFLSEEEYLHLMKTVSKVRGAVRRVYGAEKVYLLYADEIGHVHWHLFPRLSGERIGLSFIEKPSGELADISKVEELKKCF